MRELFRPDLRHGPERTGAPGEGGAPAVRALLTRPPYRSRMAAPQGMRRIRHPRRRTASSPRACLLDVRDVTYLLEERLDCCRSSVHLDVDVIPIGSAGGPASQAERNGTETGAPGRQVIQMAGGHKRRQPQAHERRIGAGKGFGMARAIALSSREPSTRVGVWPSARVVKGTGLRYA